MFLPSLFTSPVIVNFGIIFLLKIRGDTRKLPRGSGAFIFDFAPNAVSSLFLAEDGSESFHICLCVPSCHCGSSMS